MNKWNIQSEKDLWNEPIDWSSTYYTVILKNGQEREVRTYADECVNGNINTYWEYTDDDSGVDIDDILLWKPVEKPEDCVSENLKKEAQKYADRIIAELYRRSDKHYDKEKKCMTSVLYNVNWSEIGKEMEKCFIEGAKWKTKEE